MTGRVSFYEAQNGTVVIVHVQPQELASASAAARRRTCLGHMFGGLPVVLRCRLGSSVAYDADDHLHPCAVNPAIDTLPVFTIRLARDAAGDLAA